MNVYAHEIDKALGREYIKSNRIELGIKHFDLYVDFIKARISKEPDNEGFKERYNACIKEYNDLLLPEARNAFNARNWVKTMVICQKLLYNQADEPSIFKFLSFCYKNTNQNDLRLDFIIKYAELVPNDVENGKLLGEAYFDVDPKKYAELALGYIKTYLESQSKDIEAWNFLGHIYASHLTKDLREIDIRLNCFLKALELDPNNLLTLHNIVQTYIRAKMNAKADEIYDKIIALNGKNWNNNDHFNYAAFKIRCGDFITGFKHYEERFNPEKIKDPSLSGVYYPKMKRPKWDGCKNIKNSTLLVHFEQGLGDNIMFIRFVKHIQKYAKNVIAVVPTLLYELFKESNLPFDIYPAEQSLDELNFDYHIPLLSLPYVLKLTPYNVPDTNGYLRVTPERIKNYKDKYIVDDNTYKIGINFEGGESGKEQKRDIDWKEIKRFTDVENVQVYCLNKHKDKKFFDEIDPNLNVICLGETFKSFADTAAAALNMDLVIATDSGVLNLAGALGVKTLMPLNFDYEYRWYNTESGRTVWYDNVKTFVNECQDDWEATLEKLVAEVKRDMNEMHNK